MGKGRAFSGEFKAKVSIEAIRGQKTVAELSSEYKVHATQIAQWKRQALEKLKGAFTDKPSLTKEAEETVEGLYAKIGKLERA